MRRGGDAGPELVFGLVGALGADLDRVVDDLTELLGDYRYETAVIRLSDRLRELPEWRHLMPRHYGERIALLQDAGNELRSRTQSGSAMALLGIAGIQEEREKRGGEPNERLSRFAFVIRSLKHPAEEERLRKLYGSAFVLVAAYSPLEVRRKNLARAIAKSRHGLRPDDAIAQADELIGRDDHERGKPMGQLVRDAFPRADVFVDARRPREQVQRFLDLLFGHPFHTPTRDEFGMFQARAAALRSADLSRQIGAAILSRDGDVLALGTNEVPKAGGGLYWEGDTGDARDFQLGESESHRIRRGMLAEVVGRIDKVGWLVPAISAKVEADLDGLIGELAPLIADTTMMSIAEFGRMVHAEMAALTVAAKRGVAVRDATLVSTTFPCHNCTKHIVAAGIERVVYIEPYPKSRAAELHGDAIDVDPSSDCPGKVVFEPFVGVAPRRYPELFAMGVRDKGNGVPVKFKRSEAVPRIVEPETRGIREAEDMAVLELSRRLAQSR